MKSRKKQHSSRMFGKAYNRMGSIYVPFQGFPLAAGYFLPPALAYVERYLRLPDELEFQHGTPYSSSNGYRKRLLNLVAARVSGNSMIGRDVFDGDIVLLRHSDFDMGSENIVVIEKLGDEEGFGSWSLKKLLIRKPRSSSRTAFGDETDWNDPELVLYSYNKRIKSQELHQTGHYRVRGVLIRRFRSEEIHWVEPEEIESPGRGGAAGSAWF